METRDNLEQECFGASVFVRPPKKRQQVMKKAILDSQLENQELAAELAALKKQIASKELSWEEEKKKLLAEKDSLVSKLLVARNDLVSLIQKVESARASQKESDTKCKALEKRLVEKHIEVGWLQWNLRFQMREKGKVENSLRAECNKANKMKLSFDRTVVEFNAEWESRWIVRQEEVAAELESLQQDRKVSQIIQEKDDVITSVKNEMKALVDENLAQLTAKDAEIRQSEAEWQTKHSALEDRLRCELEAKEESFKKIEELEMQNKEFEIKWITKEQDWFTKEEDWLSNKVEQLAKERELLNDVQEWLNFTSKKEEEMMLQIIELQGLASKSDKQKARMRKEEEKAKKETEKRLEKQRKKEEERVKKEKKENEKKEKERLKREKKENEEREEKEKKENKEKERLKREKKENEEREKKEKKENEKKEKERLKREKKENEEREKKEKRERKKE